MADAVRSRQSPGPLISKGGQQLYQDHSLLKHQRQRKLRLQRIRATSVMAAASARRYQSLQQSLVERSVFEAQQQLLASALQTRFTELALMWRSAIKIQKVYRGYCGRRVVDGPVIKQSKEGMHFKLREQAKLNFQLTFHTGVLPDRAATTLQRAVKRFLFARKIARIQVAYDYFLNERMYVAYALIRKVVYTYKAKQKMKWKKFKIFRAKRMVQLKERIAVLQVKKHWQRLKLTYRLLYKRIKRFKRKLQQAKERAEKEAEDAKNALLGITRTASPEPVPVLMDDVEDSEDEEYQRMLEAARRVKIDLGKLAYNVPKEETKVFLPYLNRPKEEEPRKQQVEKPPTPELSLEEKMRRMEEAMQKPPTPPPKKDDGIPDEYKHFANRLFDRHGKPTFLQNEASPSPTARVKSPLLGRKKRKKKNTSDVPSYMQETATSRLSRKDAPPIAYPREAEAVHERRAHSTLMTPTRAFILKKSGKKEAEASKQVWRPSTVFREKQTPVPEKPVHTSQRPYRPLELPRPNRLKPIVVHTPHPETRSAVPPEPDLTQSPFSLTFQAALPELSTVMAHYSKPLTIHTKPRTALMKGYLRSSPPL